MLEATPASVRDAYLGTRDVLLGVLEVLEKGLLVPGDALVDVGLGVGEAVNGAGLSAKETVEVGADCGSERDTKQTRKGSVRRVEHEGPDFAVFRMIYAARFDDAKEAV